jgi:hypothetical protein
MPYGVAKSQGGDNARNSAFMERCVESVMKKGTPKVRAIMICKSQLGKMKRKG